MRRFTLTALLVALFAYAPAFSQEKDSKDKKEDPPKEAKKEDVEKLFKECIFVGERPEPVPSAPGLASPNGALFDHLVKVSGSELLL